MVAGAAVSAAGTLLLATEAALTTALTVVPAAGAAMPAVTARAVPAARAAVPAAVEAAAIFTGVLLCSPPEARAEVTLLALTLDVAAGMAAGDRQLLLVAWLADAAWTTLLQIMAAPLTVALPLVVAAVAAL